MKNLLTRSRTLAVPFLLGCWVCAFGQSLGTPTAEVLLGRPLEISVPARFASADSGDECVHADVFYGETRVKANQVRATVMGPDQQRRIHIEADTPVDEPVVTVSLRVGCRNTVTRNYTLLPEYPSEKLLAALDARSAQAALAATAVPLRLATATQAAPRRPAVRTAIARATETAPQRARTARAFRSEVARVGPRLRLEPIEAPEAQTLLRVSSTLAEPNGNAARRATAALLWQAINADPQELVRTSVMLQKLEHDLAQLRQSTGQTRADMAALRQRLDQAQPWYLSPVLLQVLALLVLAAGAAAGVLWYRTRHPGTAPGRWYLPQEAEAGDTAAEPVAHDAPAVPQAVPTEQRPTAPVVAQPAVPAAPAMPAVTTRVPQTAAIAPRTTATMDFQVAAAARAAPRRAADSVLRVETLAATFEEVEFLSSLGLTSDAMDVLKGYLQDSAGPAPVAFFDLMRLCDQAEDPAALSMVRRRYAQAFGVEAPKLERVTAPIGLESMPDLSARITLSWATPGALDIIEQVLFSVPAPAAPLTLQAGRDLLCLHDLARALITETAAPPGAGDAGHPLAPWAHAEDPLSASAAAQSAAEAHGGHLFALDVDLTAAAAAPVQEPPAREAAPDLELAPALAEISAAAAREELARRAAQDEDAFSAAMASERIPVSRY
jgi:hypothetical protein